LNPVEVTRMTVEEVNHWHGVFKDNEEFILKRGS
jgi:hypothetical protein